MSYQVLARKWRPKSFHDLAGQEHVLQTLVHALDNQRLHHAYLFTGTRGVGKTTIARILAKCLNCEEGVSSTPCGVCASCTEIDAGRFMDLIEVDAASRTRVEDTRELLDNVQYAPGKGRFKVYLIDEVHMLSTHSFNALLKTLEEPPPHVKFLLATTDPQKLPVTILSRCLQLSLKNLSPALIVDYLEGVLAAEQIAFDESALWHLAASANGSMRDALTLLDQAISYGEGEVREAAVSALLGTPDQSVVFRFAELVRDRNSSGLLAEVSHVAEHNPDFATLLQHLTSLFHRLAVAQMAPRAVDNSLGDRKQLLALAKTLTAEDVHLYYQICIHTLRDMALAPDRRMAFEMGLLRMIAFSPDEFSRPVEPLSDQMLEQTPDQTPDQSPEQSTPTQVQETAAETDEKKKARTHRPE
jgi:DNA polymerase-3 subunit gamma/tau